MIEGGGELAAGGRPAQPPGADVGQAREGGFPVVPCVLGEREVGAPEWGGEAVWEAPRHRSPYPFWLD